MGLTAKELIEKIRKAYCHPDQQILRIQEIVCQQQPVIGEEITLRSGRSCLRDFIPITVDGRSYGRLWQHTDITDANTAKSGSPS